MISKITPQTLEEVQNRYSIFNNFNSESFDGKFTFSASDDLLIKGLPTTCGSEMLVDFDPVYESTPALDLISAGGKLVGKTRMDEFAFGNFGITSKFGIGLNPFGKDRISGGNASGCAAAIFENHVALGTKICGTSSFCGVYGLAPTFGRVSRFGLLEQASSMDKIGLAAKDPKLLAEYIPKICRKDPKDITSLTQPEFDFGNEVKSIAIPSDATKGVSDAVSKAFNDSVELLKSNGVEVKTVDIPETEYASAAHAIFASTEGASTLARFTGMRYGQQDGDYTLKFDDYFTDIRTKYFGPRTKEMIILGTYVKIDTLRDKYYVKSHMVRNSLIAKYEKILSEVDAIVTPTMPFAAPTVADAKKMSINDDFAAGRFTDAAELAGLPQLTVPCGYDGEMPLGMQFMSKRWTDGMLIKTAEKWDSVFDVKEAVL